MLCVEPLGHDEFGVKADLQLWTDDRLWYPFRPELEHSTAPYHLEIDSWHSTRPEPWSWNLRQIHALDVWTDATAGNLDRERGGFLSNDWQLEFHGRLWTRRDRVSPRRSQYERDQGQLGAVHQTSIAGYPAESLSLDKTVHGWSWVYCASISLQVPELAQRWDQSDGWVYDRHPDPSQVHQRRISKFHISYPNFVK